MYKEGKYEVPMLWLEKKSFPNNYNVALKRFNKLKQQLKRDPDFSRNIKIP